MIHCLTDVEQRSIKQDNNVYTLVALGTVTFRSVSSGYMMPGKNKTYRRVCISYCYTPEFRGVMENYIAINMSPTNNRPFVVCYNIYRV